MRGSHLIIVAILLVSCAGEPRPDPPPPPEESPAQRKNPPEICTHQECGRLVDGTLCGVCETGLSCREGRCYGNECDDGNETPWDGCSFGRKSEFQVNEIGVGDQAHPEVAATGSGEFFVVWDSQVKGTRQVVSRRFSSSGEALTRDFVWSEGEGDSCNPDVDSQGEWIGVVWQTKGREKGGIWAASSKVNAGGFVRRWEARVAEESATDPHVAICASEMIIVWSGAGKGNKDIHRARLDAATGRVLEPGKVINQFADFDQTSPDVVCLSDGGHVVSWESLGNAGESGRAAVLRAFREDGEAFGNEFVVGRAAREADALGVRLASGKMGVLVVWRGESGTRESAVWLQHYSSEGKPQGKPLRVNVTASHNHCQPCPLLAPDGEILVVWENWIRPEEEGEVTLRRVLPSDSSPPPRRLNVEMYDGQGDPSLASTPDGDVMAVWYSFDQDGDERGIFARMLDNR